MQEYIEKEYTSKFDWSLWLKMLKQLTRHKSKVYLLIGVMTFNALIDTILPLMTKYGIDNMIIPKDYSGIQTFSLIYFLLIVFQFVNVYLLIDVAGRIETGLNFDLRSKAFRKLQSMSFSYFDRTSSGWIVARVTSDINRLGDVVAWGIVDLIWGFAMIIFVLIVVFTLSWKLALILLGLMPIIAILSHYFQGRMFRLFRQVRRFNSMITHSFGEGIHGAKTTKTLVCEDTNLQDFKDLSQKMYGSSIKSAITSALFMPMILMVSSLGTGIVVWLGGSAVLAQTISYGTMVAFISYTMHLFEPFSNVARLFAEMQHAQASAERVFSLINLEQEITSYEAYTPEWQERTMQGKISIQDMSFAYKEAHPIFSNFNLEIAPGESIALVGETGTGKTTLVNLICRFYEPQQGSIKIDDIDYKELPLKWIHSNLGYVQQVPHLFQGSVMENIRYGRLDASDEQVMEAARMVRADEFIQNLPDKYDYKVGEAGNLLSTGQKQLIAFARVVLADPALLILDEATASIDTETEQLVQGAMHVVLSGRTGIIVAHRLSTIRQVDRILLLHKGEILEMGNHHDLMRRKGRYYQLYMNQFMQEVADEEFQKEA
ncbi:MAG TPA: ABC transporter ATP-binding protein [Candidatus Cloacimonadota bacterium]|nr:ABC transporter ATP-binding protein [Candidatus Cloacimonadota bacterium]